MRGAMGSTVRAVHATGAARMPRAAGGASFSRCRRYRYALWRHWSTDKHVLFVMLNPATADAERNDPTIRRCIGFAKAWGFGGLTVANLFAWRTVSPAALKRADEPVGARNDRWLTRLIDDADLVVAAWGNHGAYLARSTRVRGRFTGWCHLGINKTGEPRHPLYAPGATRPQRWA